MNRKNKILVFDLVAFAGGSKKATASILYETGIDSTNIVCLTKDPESWRSTSQHIYRLHEPGCFSNAEQGFKFYLRQVVILLAILVLHCRFGRFSLVVGSSGPGVDFALMLYRMFTGSLYCQLIHGPVSRSRSIGFALSQTDLLGVLESEKKSTYRALRCVFDKDKGREKFCSSQTLFFQNGMTQHEWPSERVREAQGIFWAASLLKWKGLDTLLQAVDTPTFNEAISFTETTAAVNICYIKPVNSLLPQTAEPNSKGNIRCFEKPANIDEIRRHSSVFVSTSQNEPFGLSILEALAAGLCVVIPQDGAYWDRKLVDGVNCVKYSPGDHEQLARLLGLLIRSPKWTWRIGRAGIQEAQEYRASNRYASLATSLRLLQEKPIRDWVTP